MTARGQVRHAFPAFRVFIFGTDVTEDVLDVSVSWNLGRAPNTCSITLANPDDKYIFTSTDLRTLYKNQSAIIDAANENNRLFRANIGEIDLGINTYLDEQDIRDKINLSVAENISLISPQVKQEILLRKFAIKTSESFSAIDVDGTEATSNILNGTAARYPLSAEDPIFHPKDPIRIFFRDPFKPSRWYHMFAGFAADYDDNVDENNQRILTITGEGPSRELRYARITTNPGIIDIRARQVVAQDAVSRSVWESGFTKLTLPELLFLIIFGNNPDDDTKFSIPRDSPAGITTAQTRLSGVGHFNYQRSAVIEFGPSSSGGSEDALQSVSILPIENLGNWQSLIDHEVKITDLEEMAVPEFDGTSLFDAVVRFADGTPDPTSIIKIIGLNPQLFPVDGGRLLMLLPASFHPQVNREVLLKDMISNFRLETEFASRLGIIYDTIERIEFLFYESPKGDLICEFPLYDFDPDDWSLDGRTPHVGVDNQSLFFSTQEERGPFGSRYIISKMDTYNFARQFSDEKVRTQMIAYWQTIQNMLEIGDSRQYTAPAVVNLPHLFPLYGIRAEQVPPKAFIGTKEAASALCHVWLNKMNADAINIGINAIPNFGLWLNRPLQFLPRNMIGTTASLTHSIKWGMGGSVDTRVNLRYIRTWDGLLDSNGKALYTPIGGQASRPLDYKLLFKLKNAKSSRNEDSPSTG